MTAEPDDAAVQPPPEAKPETTPAKPKFDWKAWLMLHRRDLAKGLFEVVTVLLIYFTFAETRRQADEARNQTRLMHEQLRSTQAAVLRVSFGLGAEGLRMGIENIGHSTAYDFKSHFVVTRESLPDRKPLGTAQPFDTGPREFKDGPEFYVTDTYPLRGFRPLDWEIVFRTEQSVTVKGTYEYLDGFDERISRDFCYSFLRAEIPIRAEKYNYNGFMPCAQFQAAFHNLQAQK